MHVELRLLGGASLLADGRVVSGGAAQPRRLAVLAVLAHAWPAVVTRDRLVGLIWPEQDEAGARRLLTQALYELRRELGEFTVTSGRDVALDPSAITVDVVEFRRAAEAGDLERAATLYRGPFLDGFFLRGSDEFERWVSGVRDELSRQTHRTIDKLVAQLTDSARFDEAAAWAQRQVALTPFDARAAIRAIDAADRAGDPATGLKVAAEYVERMRSDLGAEPDPEVARRASLIRSGGTRPSMDVTGPEPVQLVSSAPSALPAPDAHRAPHWWLRRSTFWFAVAAAIAVMIASVRPSYIPRAARGEHRVAVTDFSGFGDSTAAALAPVLRSALISSLDGSGGVRLAPASSDGAAARLSGSVTANGPDVRLDAELVSSADSPPLRVSVSGPRGSLVSLMERLALEMLPAFYPDLRSTPGMGVARRFQRVAVARRYLDGELAFHRGAFEEAFRAFRAATELDSTAAYAWYRRAVAGEDAHRIADANRSALLADELSESLAPTDRGLIAAYAVWRSGDIRAADSLYRRLIASEPNNAELWYQFAEVSYHGGPVVGRRLDLALDAWRRAVALDSASFPALMHLLRLEAGVGNEAAIRVLTDRVERIGAGEPLISEVKALNAAVAAAAGGTTYDERQFARMPDASTHFVHAQVAGMVERPDIARVAAAALVAAERPVATRAEGFTALAHIAVARGQLRLAAAMLDSLARLQPAAADGLREYFAALPFLRPGAFPAPRAASAGPSRGEAGAPLYLEVTVDASAASALRAYRSALARSIETRLDCDTRDAAARELCADLERGLRAEAALARGDSTAALTLLESMSLRVPYQLAGRSVFYARTRERFRRAQLLERAGLLADAFDWYAATPHAARYDYVYLAPSHLGQARIRERQGDRGGAREHYRRVIELWRDCDSTLVPLRAEAEAAFRRLSED